VSGELPIELLYCLPEWCVYIETPGKNFGPHRMNGFFAHLEYGAYFGHGELRLLIDHADDTPFEFPFSPIPLHLVPGGIPASIDAFLRRTEEVICPVDQEKLK